MGDVSYVLGLPDWANAPETRFGVRGTWRSLDRFSPRYCPAAGARSRRARSLCDPTAPGANGSRVGDPHLPHRRLVNATQAANGGAPRVAAARLTLQA